jgi:phytol kinase
MMSPTGAMAAVMAALGGFMLGVRSLQMRSVVGPELGRKLVHAGMGVIALSFPWIFRDSRPVWALAALSIGILCAVRLVPPLTRRFGAVLGGVDRASLGEIFFPLGIACAFALAQGEPAPFCGAISVLAFADTAGALVGSRWGRMRYSVFGNRKSGEGSAAVWIASAACIAAASALPPTRVFASGIAAALGMGLAAMLVEAVSSFGLDNLLLPVVVVELMRK